MVKTVVVFLIFKSNFHFIKETIDNVNIRVTFENNGQISSTDSSVEACCLYILHQLVLALYFIINKIFII